MTQKQCVAMLLAGGEGKRLGILTSQKAKPAVHFGGSARMIDFALSNCRHSCLDTVGVVTQYRPEALHRHIGLGSAWLEKPEQGEIALLSSRQSQIGERGYLGTADAIYRNWSFIEKYNPDTVLVLSGDHIYHMDYRKLLEHHLTAGADATIAVTPVPISEASRFGIMKTDSSGRITEFAEKPKAPASNLASMGIYIFNTSFLRTFLERDAQDSSSSHDFGKNVIPAMLEHNAKLYAYEFADYWKDVGTIESLWEAHMDLLGGSPAFVASRDSWPLYSANGLAQSRFVESLGLVRQSLICSDCTIHGQVERSVISTEAVIGQGSRIFDSVIMPGAQIGSGVTIYKSIVGEGAVVRDGTTWGSADGEMISVIGDREVISIQGQKLPKIFVSANQLQAELIG
ncbi:glucose-1-phosphate adenylyltransferase [Paenibacillus sp. 32352]|uniref:glucose-1-phosphate adenylyltransferase n=1 Tax=Paenibacillus sp. 32352 TaxID=1969111 RepID=UPI0009AE2510|nr:glucose-1-phosphate adenylyltransferase [Paenibacillus sp. 32352]